MNPNALNAMYIINDINPVIKFLDTHTYLNPLIVRAYDILRTHFPTNPLYMEVFDSQEGFDTDLELIISIGMPISEEGFSVENSIALLDKFDEEWWFDNCTESQGKLCITLKYIN